jgi:hypothetical protein
MLRTSASWSAPISELSDPLQIVKNSSDLLRLLEQGNTVRRVASTNMNERSSRSHSCFTIKIEQRLVTELAGGVTREQVVSAKLNLVDLAGSERASKTGATGSTLKEGAKINLSLMTLGTVINALAAGDRGHIPYRDSQLTRLLQVRPSLLPSFLFLTVWSHRNLSEGMQQRS